MAAKMVPAVGGGKITPSAVFAENRLVSNRMRQLFLWHGNRLLGLSTQLSVSLYLLPVLRGRFGSNVHVTGFATTSIVHLWNKDINFIYVIFLVLETENGKMTRQEYKNGICTFSRWPTKEVVIGRHLEHSHSHGLIQPNESEVSITVILAR